MRKKSQTTTSIREVHLTQNATCKLLQTNHWLISCTSHISSGSTVVATPWSDIANVDECLARSTQL